MGNTSDMYYEVNIEGAAKRAAEWAERERVATGLLEQRRAAREAAVQAANAERWQREYDQANGR